MAGVYTLTYTATDVARNTASVQRTVTVVAVAAWTQLDRRTRSIDPVSMFVLGANEVPHVVEEINDGSGNRSLTLKKLNTSGVLTVVNSISGQAFNGVSLALGSDNTTLFMGTVSSLYSTTSIGNWNIVDNVVWNSVGGYGLQIGPGNTPYIAAMDYNTFAMRIWKRVGGTWGVVGSDINIPLNNGGGVSDKIFCVTPSGGVYTIGVDYSDPGVSVASLNGSLWNIEKIYSTEGSNHQIVAAGSNLYASFRNGTDYVIYQKASGSWSTTAMSNTGVAATSFSMAASPTGTLYGARLEGTNVVVKKLVGAAWQSVGSATAFTTTSGSNIQILPGTTKCYAVVKTSNEWIIYSITN